MKDSQGKTGKEIIQPLNARELLECTTTEDLRECKERLLAIARDGKDSDAVSAIKTLFEYVVSKPKQEVENTNKNINIDSGCSDDDMEKLLGEDLDERIKRRIKAKKDKVSTAK